MVANNNRRPDGSDFIRDTPFLPGNKDPNEEKETFEKTVVQSLKGILAIVRKHICRQIERRKNYKEPEYKIPPQQQCDYQIGRRLQVFGYVRVQRLTVQG
jgi:hypothetical protein